MDKRRSHRTLAFKGANTACFADSYSLLIGHKDAENESFLWQGPEVNHTVPEQCSPGNTDIGSAASV
jgi:hypothetical protein